MDPEIETLEGWRRTGEEVKASTTSHYRSPEVLAWSAIIAAPAMTIFENVHCPYPDRVTDWTPAWNGARRRSGTNDYMRVEDSTH